MGLSILGYVLEPPRVGQSNSAFTLTPNNYISDSIAFNAAFPSDESAPRAEYCVFVLNDFVLPGTGPDVTRSFADATFAWTKNQVVQRFDYTGADGRFKPLPGSTLVAVGVLASDSNTNRLKVPAPISADLANFPVRVSIGTNSGVTFVSSTVLNDGSFSVPAVGAVQISLATGNLNWNPADLITFAGQNVRFQKQTFYTFNESTGNIGLIDDVLLLNPLPKASQAPLIRIGFGEYLTPVEVLNEAGFSFNPLVGTVEWAATTGRLKFNSGDVSANTGRNIYYDGVVLEFGLTVKITNLGTVTTPGVLAPLPPEASDLFFRVSGVVQFIQTQFVDTLTSPGKKGLVQVRRSDGQILFSAADQNLYGALSVQAIVPDIDVDSGLTLRLFRTPVNLDDVDPTLKDVAAFYTTENAIWANPIIASPAVLLPAVPDDSRPLTVIVAQGTGTFTSSNFPRLDIPSPPTGLGYVIDFEQRQLLFAQRKFHTVILAPTPYGGVQLPDPLVFSSNLLLELETSPNSGLYTPLTVGEDALIDLASGLVTLVSTEGDLITSGPSASFVGTTFTDTSQNFTANGVLPGDFLIVLTGLAKGVYVITSVGTTTLTMDVAGVTSSDLAYEVRRGVEILADRFLSVVPPVDPNTKVERIRSLGTVSNLPRLTIDPTKAPTSRFRFGKTIFSTSTIVVVNDGAFTAPGSLPQGTVEVSQSTGHVNFSQADVTAGGLVYWSRTLTLGVEYTLQAPLGFVQLTERMLESEEAFVTYKNADGDLIQERVTFLVRKELTQPHPAPTNTLSFNPLGREVASTPTPLAFRGGRPQTSSQVLFDTDASTVTFIGAPTVTNALPSGPTVNPNENVYVDYNIYEAIGGEQSFTVLQPPMQGVTIIITEGLPTFQIAGDRTGVFAPNILLLVDRTETYLIGSSSYDSGTQITTVTLASPQVFRSDFQNPTLAVSSGPIRVTGSPIAPSYFVTELAAYDPIPRGSSKFRLQGDLSRIYVTGTVVLFTDTGFTDFNLVSGSVFDKASGKTEVTLTSNGARQYSGVTLKRSVRPILASPSGSATAFRSPELGQPVVVFRRVDGQVGVILSQPVDYKIDASGVVTLTDPLTFNEEIGIFYTGDTIIEAGRSFRASYTFGIAPSEQNGLLSQILEATYTTYAPDTFFWRVETFTNFRGELVEAYTEAAKASVPTAGPTLENSSSPKLFEQGRESVFFQEGFLANEDLVARPTLKYFNDAINLLEDVLQDMDGRVVGDHDGRFLFDGNIDNPARTTFASVTNQIDDRFKISPAPYSISFPPFVATSIGTFQEVYKPAPTSRFYPTQRTRYGVTVAGVQTGDPIMDIGSKKLSAVGDIHRRFPWAVTTVLGRADDGFLNVDDADGSDVLVRPSFANGMKVAITAQDGTVLVPDSSSVTVLGFTSTTITLGVLPTDIPPGSTVRLATNDTTYQKFYRLGIDLGVDLEKGLLTFVDPTIPVWAVLTPSAPAAGETLDLVAAFPNSVTSPDRFPALDGGTMDDDNNRQFPVLMPWAKSESSASGYLVTELHIINSATGTLRAATSPTFLGTGDLDGTGTIITNTGGNWPSPIPKIHDIVSILTGPNGPSIYHRITAVGAATITVATAFPVPGDTGFSFTVSTNTSLATGAAGIVSPTNTVTDGAANFFAANVLPGHTIVITSGPNAGLRRQITAVNSAISLTVVAFPTTFTASYRIDNSLSTFGAANSLLNSELVPALNGETAILSTNVNPLAEIPATNQFFNAVFTDIATGSNGQSVGSTFTAVGQTFVTDEVTTSDLLFVRSGAVAGFYKIQAILSQTSLTIEGSFPVNTTGIVFRIVKSIGLTADPLNGVLTAVLAAETFLTSIAPFISVLTALVPVAGDAGAYAIRLKTSDLNARETLINARVAQIPDSITAIESELSAGDRLYDKRYTWIDARINLEKGILFLKDLAVVNRIKAQADVLKQLTKLLSVQAI